MLAKEVKLLLDKKIQTRQDRKEDTEPVFDLLNSDHWTLGIKTIINAFR